jgi:hypothetical protein
MKVRNRLWFAVLIAADWLLGTHLVDRELARMQRCVETCQAQASAIHQHIEDLNHLLHVVQVELCVLYLRQRRALQPQTWRRFAPAESTSEGRILDWLIGQLVKCRLATVRIETVGEQTYVYYLRPDWAAIADLLSAWKEHLDPVTVPWLEEIRSSQNGKILH